MTESVIDFPKNTLCPDIWETVVDISGTKEIWQLRQDVKDKLNILINAILSKVNIANISKFNIHITGSITSNSYTENADIDLHFQFIEGFAIREFSEMTQKRFKHASDEIKQNQPDVFMIGKHPIEVYFQPNKFQDFMSVGCYDFKQSTWLVGPDFTDPSFNPYSEYYKEIQVKSNQLASQIRNKIFSIYELAVVIKKNANTEFEQQLYPILIERLNDAKNLYEQIREMRKVYSSPTSVEEALAFRASRKWKIADASFKLFDKYGYLAILKSFIEVHNTIEHDFSLSQMAAEYILKVVKEYINNADKLSEQELYEGEQVDESMKDNLAKIILAFTLSIPGLVSAKTIEYAAKDLDNNSKEFQEKQHYFDNAFKGINLDQKFGEFNFCQAANILAVTYFGEGRGEIAKNAFNPIVDTTINRAAGKIKDVPYVCIAKGNNTEYYQYSFWNKNKKTLDMIKDGKVVVPSEIKDNIIEKRAWDHCIKMAIDVLTGKYKPQNTKINSYYVANMDDPPKWSKQMTDDFIKGSHRFGYVKSNDPKYRDMTLRNNTTKTALTTKYKVKEGDTLDKIAKKFSTTIASIMKQNNIKDKNKIFVGQVLKI